MSARVVGVTIRCEPKRPLPWGLYIDARIGGERVSGTRFFATEAEAEAHYPAVAAEVARRRDEAKQQALLKQALGVPALPVAPRGSVLFEPMALRWLEEHVREMCTAATYRGYHRLLHNHLLPIMRTWPVSDETMSPMRITEVLKVQLYEKSVPLPTRLACHATLSAFFSWARTKLPPKHLTSNPAEQIAKYIRNKAEKHVQLIQAPNPMTRAQAEAFLSWQQEHAPAFYPWFLWLIDEGSRIGEVSALKWAHIDLARGKAHVVEAYSSSQRWMERRTGEDSGRRRGEKDTKTHRSNQYIDLSPRVVDALVAQKTANLEAWMARGRYGKEPEHVFLNRALQPRRPDKVIYTSFRKACVALDLKGQTGKPFTIHCLRDTFATLSILEGKPLGWVSMQLGHADQKTTEKHYFKWLRLVEENVLMRGQK